ncbi:endonuclease/exonuclease/phosphatase family protein, partial [Trifolium medium]|nr:endonuclease/exonuclease/phosphatase family protein [Trifolium medium]
MVGDFNSIRSVDERKGVAPGSEVLEDTRVFNIFVDNLGLVDLSLMGRKFSWMQPNG